MGFDPSHSLIASSAPFPPSHHSPVLLPACSPPLHNDQASSAKPVLNLLRYRNQVLPDGTIPSIAETPAHFDVREIRVTGPYSLHTEYASKARAFDSDLLAGLDAIKASQRRGVPELWSSKEWAQECAEFIFRLVGDAEAPSIIEVHPPFVSSTPNIEAFLQVCEVFECAILERFPQCTLAIENRSGTKHPHAFLVSDAASILAMGKALIARDLRLGIALDLPQMFTQAYGSKHPVGLEGARLLESLIPIREKITALHLWGRGEAGGAHSGGLDGLFDPGSGSKEACLALLKEMCSDGRPRHLVVEITRNADLVSILDDLASVGFNCESGR